MLFFYFIFPYFFLNFIHYFIHYFWYSVESTVAKSVDVEIISHRFSSPGERSDTDSFEILKLLLAIMDVVDEFLNLLREYKNICGKVRLIKFSIKSKHFHQSIESACNYFRNRKS